MLLSSRLITGPYLARTEVCYFTEFIVGDNDSVDNKRLTRPNIKLY